LRKREREREMSNMSLVLVITIVVFFGHIGDSEGGDLRKNFYKSACPLAEEIVQNITWKHAASNSALPAKFLRMHFHDCFVRVRTYVYTMSSMHSNRLNPTPRLCWDSH